MTRSGLSAERKKITTIEIPLQALHVSPCNAVEDKYLYNIILILKNSAAGRSHR